MATPEGESEGSSEWPPVCLRCKAPPPSLPVVRVFNNQRQLTPPVTTPESCILPEGGRGCPRAASFKSQAEADDT